MALQFGLHVARICRPIFITDRLSDDSSDNVESNNNSVNRQLQLTRRSKLASLVIAVFLALTIVAFWLLAFYDTPRNYWWIAVCLGPTGALLRYNLSLLNVRFSSFPMFTFLANISASFAGMIILICACRQNVGNEFQFWIVNGVSVGLLGCLSTVSTFINELHKLSAVSLGIAYRYGLVSFFCSLILCLCLGGFWILADKSLNC